LDQHADATNIEKRQLWRRAIEKEMAKAKVAFKKVQGYTPDDVRMNKALVGYKEIKGHMIFDIKLDGNFTRRLDLLVAVI